MASVRADFEAGRAVLVPARGRRLSVAELNAVLENTPYRVTALRAKA